MIFLNSFKYKFKFITPDKPNNSKLLIALPISSAIPQEKPAAFDARFDVVSISLRDCIIS